MKAITLIAGVSMVSLSLLETACRKSSVPPLSQSPPLEAGSATMASLKGWGTRRGFEAGMKELAGPGAVDCGRIPVGADRQPAVECVLAGSRSKKPFQVVFEEQGVDSEVETAIVHTPAGAVTSFFFDGMGASSTSSPCPAPLQLQLDKAGGVDCDGPARK